MNWREQKRAARQIVHDTMKVEARYYPPRGAGYTTVHVRLHTKWGLIGDSRSMGWAEMEAIKPRLVFMREEQEPETGAVVWIAVGEAYRIDNTNPPDDIERIANVTRLTPKQYADAGLPT
ncbi:hypothetical protein AH2_00060 [Burkholderia phage vB_BceS_AH2]|uniref:Uncharacterized protein n=1 Tax=Burkholderia phage vB_BceS_AH2 TaxID=1133022 RepID=I6NLJ3_9CAUD|nr:hypothetical protein B613_gp60 [Burkholderia phage vB_BceS_AH2]AEY69570.1 hypothetical protein AH2_00060 [Burkholderia phage vB_BceS_AH2]